MPYHFIPQQVLILNQGFNLAEWFNVFVVGAIGVIAGIIAHKELKLKDFAEIWVKPIKNNENDKWMLKIMNGGPRIVYLHSELRTEPEEDRCKWPKFKFSRNELASLPNGDEFYYTLPIPEPKEINNTFHIFITFEDILGKRYNSHHAGWFINDRWVVHNLKSR